MIEKELSNWHEWGVATEIRRQIVPELVGLSAWRVGLLVARAVLGVTSGVYDELDADRP